MAKHQYSGSRPLLFTYTVRRYPRIPPRFPPDHIVFRVTKYMPSKFCVFNLWKKAYSLCIWSSWYRKVIHIETDYQRVAQQEVSVNLLHGYCVFAVQIWWMKIQYWLKKRLIQTWKYGQQSVLQHFITIYAAPYYLFMCLSKINKFKFHGLKPMWCISAGTALLGKSSVQAGLKRTVSTIEPVHWSV